MANILKPPCDEGVIRTSASPGGCPPRAAPWVLAVTIIGSGMTFIDGTVVNVALPALQAAFGATMAQVQWVVESYALTLSAFILAGGALGDRFGRRRMFAAGIVLFGAASAWCGLSRDAAELIAARAVQGVGAALLVPGSLAIISAEFDEHQRGRAIGTWSGATAILAAVGPVLGGWFIEVLSWRWVFFLNLPLCLIVLPLLYRFVRESRDDQAPPRIDWAGTALAALGLGLTVFGLIEAAAFGLAAPRVWGSLLAGLACLAAFGVAEAVQRDPMVPPGLFRSRTFSGANLLTLLLYAALGGAFFFLPFHLIQIHGYTATAAGAALLPLILIIFALSRWAGGLVDRYGARRPLIAGPAIAALGYVLLALPGSGGSYWTTFLPGTAVLGLGMAITVAPLTTAVMNSVETRLAGTASGVNNAVARTAGVLAIAVFGILVFGVFGANLAERAERIGSAPEIGAFVGAARTRVAAAEVPASLPEDVAAGLRAAVEQSFTAAFRLAMLLAAALALAAAGSGAALIAPRGAAGPVPESGRG